AKPCPRAAEASSTTTAGSKSGAPSQTEKGSALPHLWGSTRRRRGMGPGLEVFPIYGEVPAEGGGWGQGWRSSPFMGKYPPKAGDGARAGGLPPSGAVPAEGGGSG